MNTPDNIILLRVPEPWLRHQREQLAKHPLYENLSDYIRALADCGEAALALPRICATCKWCELIHEDDEEPCTSCGTGERELFDAWEFKLGDPGLLRKEDKDAETE